MSIAKQLAEKTFSKRADEGGILNSMSETAKPYMTGALDFAEKAKEKALSGGASASEFITKQLQAAATDPVRAALIGGTAGIGLGYLGGRRRPKEERQGLTDSVLGGIAGASIGAGIPLLASRFSNAYKSTDSLEQTRSALEKQVADEVAKNPGAYGLPTTASNILSPITSRPVTTAVGATLAGGAANAFAQSRKPYHWENATSADQIANNLRARIETNKWTGVSKNVWEEMANQIEKGSVKPDFFSRLHSPEVQDLLKNPKKSPAMAAAWDKRISNLEARIVKALNGGGDKGKKIDTDALRETLTVQPANFMKDISKGENLRGVRFTGSKAPVTRLQKFLSGQKGFTPKQLFYTLAALGGAAVAEPYLLDYAVKPALGFSGQGSVDQETVNRLVENMSKKSFDNNSIPKLIEQFKKKHLNANPAPAPTPKTDLLTMGKDFTIGAGLSTAGTVAGLGALGIGAGLMRMPGLSKLFNNAAKESVLFLHPARSYRLLKRLKPASELAIEQQELSSLALRNPNYMLDPLKSQRAKILSDRVKAFEAAHGESPADTLEKGIGVANGVMNLGVGGAVALTPHATNAAFNTSGKK